MRLRVAVMTSSDRVAAGTMEDRGGPAIESQLDPSVYTVVDRAVLPDDRYALEHQLVDWADGEAVDIVLTTGGTGLGPRDVMPEATAAVCDRLVPGMAEAMRAAGLTVTPFSMLSRALVGSRGTTLIVNLPGNPDGAVESLKVVLPVIQHAIAILHGGKH